MGRRSGLALESKDHEYRKAPKASAPANAIARAVKVMRILTGEEPEDFGSEAGKDKAAQELGRKGGKKRAASMTAERRADIAKRAALALGTVAVAYEYRGHGET